ncbi:hypothetical protein TNCV_2586491 [Trichonephila clavipes]|nr:hypothetical protein TNCV_2586491 [Trichonephila clavipes]
MEYRLSEYSPTERKVDDREGQCNVWYNGNCKGGFYTSLQLAFLGRVVEVYHGSDGKVRTVRIKTKNGEFRRPITKICILPIDVNN